MKNKQQHLHDLPHRFVRILKSGLIFGVLLTLLIGILFRAPAQALPAEKYRYFGGSCSSNDAECFKYSAEAGSYRAYKSILNRQPETTGFSYWANRLQNGTSSLQDVAANLIGSSEWKNKFGTISNQQFVTQTYQFALGRSPSNSDNNYWVNELNNGRSRANMAASFITSSEAANVQHSAFMNYFRPPTPSPSPTPKPSPTPTPPKPSSPKAQAPSQSNASASGLRISDFTISELEYRSTLLTWKTNKPSTTKANYSTNKDDLYTEQKNDDKVTDHTLRLEGDGIKAGRHYFVRITSDDGSGPVTIDGEFDTKSIAVIIAVTDESNQPATEAIVTAGEVTATTDSNGEALLSLPEGEISIFAEKDDLSQQITATIEVPNDETPQRISLSLSKISVTELTSEKSSKKGFPWGWLLLIPLIIAAGIGGFIFWKRRQNTSSYSTYQDPLEAENYNAAQIPSTPFLPPTDTETHEDMPPAPPVPEVPIPEMPAPPAAPEPSYQELENLEVPHHPSLPELVGRYGQTTPPPSVESAAELTPAGQPIPHHASLKELVEIPNTNNGGDPTPPPVDDLPTSPLESSSEPTKNDSEDLTTEKDEDGALNIKH